MDIDRVYGIWHLSRAQKAVIFFLSLEGERALLPYLPG